MVKKNISKQDRNSKIKLASFLNLRIAAFTVNLVLRHQVSLEYVTPEL